MKKLISMFFAVILLCSSITTTTYANDENLRLYAQSAVLMDGETGRILFSKDGEDTKANASTTKILTCILALEYGEMTDVVTASPEAVSQPKVHLGVKNEETFYLKDMLYALMLESYNDCAVIIAEHISGSVEAFATLMNEKAEEIGCIDTYFITPNGLDAENGYEYHHTTAEDLCLLMRYCIKESPKVEEFLSITQTPSHSFSNVEGTRSFTCTNRNTLLTTMTEAISGKTGFTNNAGYCYVGAIESEGRTFIVALLACGWPSNRNYKWSDCQTLFSYGKENYHYELIEEAVSEYGKNLSTQVWFGDTTEDPYQMQLKTQHLGEQMILKREDEEIKKIYQYQSIMMAPVLENELVGSLRYMIDEEIISVVPITTTEAVERKKSFFW